ncbi:FAD-dependent monooxygenase [Bradyrhizobium sp. Arg68]|uniref:FAD-dependent oxidoreductase n=1 Tax=Bradyrhizobium ivorense TaxID=2511166 RepID=UPI001E63D17C|nr:NAD(P)/FAD-dependent oxidoreductase [Bradyrhizobium ivorense]MCC8936946.1 FAD-dependent monooxygenase [Bradyrhizobium ivorense]
MNTDFEVAIVGGSLSGAALGLALAKRGIRVLILERDSMFRDRVRGEGMHPWGAAEAQALSILELLTDGCGQEVPYWTRHNPASTPVRRDLPATTPGKRGCVTFYHPAMQERLRRAASEAGAVVWRPSLVVRVAPGQRPELTVQIGGREQSLQVHLVVGADGRSSRMRVWGGFRVQKDPDLLRVSGVLHADLDLDESSVHSLEEPVSGRKVLIFPIGGRSFRSYFVSRAADGAPLSGERHAQTFLDACLATGAPPIWLKHAKTVGPLASFNVADQWVDHPYRDGIVLIGDAAAASDPCYGCGLSLTLRDVRTLRDNIAANPDWRTAAEAYADEHDRYFGALHRILSWNRDLSYASGPAAEARRTRVRDLLRRDPRRWPDFLGLGPDAPNDEAARRRFFGED